MKNTLYIVLTILNLVKYSSVLLCFPYREGVNKVKFLKRLPFN